MRFAFISFCCCSLIAGVFVYSRLSDNDNQARTNYSSYSSRTEAFSEHTGEENEGYNEKEEQDAENPAQQDSLWKVRLCDPATGEIPENIRRRELDFTAKIPTREMMRQGKQGREIQAVQWEFRGPSNVAGRVRSMAMDIDDESVLLAGGVSGGVWRSTNSGATWARSSSLDEGISVTSIVQDTRAGHRNVWYYGTGEGGKIPLGEGMYKSQDRGLTWRLLSSTKTNDFLQINKVLVDTKNQREDVVFAATGKGIMRSTDGGQTWKVVLISPDAGRTSSHPLIDIVISENGVFYAALGGYSSSSSYLLYRSSDGLQWTNIGTSAPLGAASGRIQLAVTPDGNALYVSAESGKAPLFHSLAKYTYLDGDGVPPRGRWDDRTNILPGSMITYGGYTMALKVHPANPNNYILLAGVSSYVSFSGWNPAYPLAFLGCHSYRQQESCIDYHDFIFSYQNPLRMYITSDQGIHVTTNSLRLDSAGLSLQQFYTLWTKPLNQSLNITQFYTVAIDKQSSSNIFIVGGTQDRGSHLGKAGTYLWTRVGGGDGFACALTNHGRTLYRSEQNGAIVRDTLDASGVATGIYGSESALNYRRTYITPVGISFPPFGTQFILDPQNNEIMYYICKDTLWVQRRLSSIPFSSVYNGRDGWQAYKVPPFENQNSTSTLNVIGASESKNRPTRLYLGWYGEGFIYRIDNPQDSLPRVSSATRLPTLFGSFISSITVDPRNPDRVIATISNFNSPSIFLSENGGKSWVHVGGNLEQQINGTGSGSAVLCSEILYVDDKPMYFVGTSTGLYSTSALNGMNTVWMKEASTVIGSSPVFALTSREADGLLVAATHGNGMFSAKYGSASVPVPTPPVIEPLSDITTRPNGPLVFSITVTDADTASLAVDVQDNTPGLSSRIDWSVTGTGGRRTGRITPRSNIINGETVITVAAMNKYGVSARRTFKWVISATAPITGIHTPSRFETTKTEVFPNPFTDNVSIRYFLAQSMSVRVSVTNILGEEVFAIPARRQLFGSHEILWNGQTPANTRAASGMYFCTLEMTDDNGRKRQAVHTLHCIR